ncbi:MAG: bifunctional phosphoribosyl-AMP cyclohydrolase/phosphoribosyl-ATP diphosphatase HisIE [Lachnospiraceae bacterium]|nr:bifunctional phosphoribosyl-AMP cyclohydrolase/phosphoribosyl-ATP diphosphatase HisIE [Lachnospiraceae bacterium]
MEYKKILPCIYLYNGKGYTWFKGRKRVEEDPVKIAEKFANYGADGVLVFDLSQDDEGHNVDLSVIKKICQAVDIPVTGAGNVKRLEDIKKLLYAGCRRACLNFSKKSNVELTEEVGKRFGRDHIGACVNSLDQLQKNEIILKNYVSEILLIDFTDVREAAEWVKMSCSHNANPVSMDVVPVMRSRSFHELAADLRANAVSGIAGGDLNTQYMDFMSFKRQCKSLGIPMNTYESSISWSEFKTNEDGLVPVIVQDYKTDEVLMLAYMNEESFNRTIDTGLMNYWSRSRGELWQKGDTSGHYQYVKSLTADCDTDTILAKVLQVGAACHTGAHSCFFREMVKKEYPSANPLKVFEDEYKIIVNRKEHPKDGSYTNYLFDKGIDKILKKMGEECTEVIIAAKNPDPEELKYELADWLYHAMVLMVEKGVTWDDITSEITSR